MNGDDGGLTYRQGVRDLPAELIDVLNDLLRLHQVLDVTAEVITIIGDLTRRAVHDMGAVRKTHGHELLDSHRATDPSQRADNGELDGFHSIRTFPQN